MTHPSLGHASAMDVPTIDRYLTRVLPVGGCDVWFTKAAEHEDCFVDKITGAASSFVQDHCA